MLAYSKLALGASAAATVALLTATPVAANWLLQCSSCVDQSYYSDETLKGEVSLADTSELLAQVKQLHVQKFTHKEDEFFNKFLNCR